jgi:hypothetical protein
LIYQIWEILAINYGRHAKSKIWEILAINYGRYAKSKNLSPKE